MQIALQQMRRPIKPHFPRHMPELRPVDKVLTDSDGRQVDPILPRYKSANQVMPRPKPAVGSRSRSRSIGKDIRARTATEGISRQAAGYTNGLLP